MTGPGSGAGGPAPGHPGGQPSTPQTVLPGAGPAGGLAATGSPAAGLLPWALLLLVAGALLLAAARRRLLAGSRQT